MMIMNKTKLYAFGELYKREKRRKKRSLVSLGYGRRMPIVWRLRSRYVLSYNKEIVRTFTKVGKGKDPINNQ